MELHNFKKLTHVIKDLLNPDSGCPWDLKQTHKSLLKYLIEESFEYIEAVESKDDEKMNEELGDILLQVLLHARIAEKENRFSLESVSKTLADKMIRRHPHVFNKTEETLSPEQVTENWNKIKEKEGLSQSIISHKLLANTALNSSYNIGKKSTLVNFDWDDPLQVSYKVEEEWQELKEEIAPYPRMNKDRVKEELGDFLFSTVQLARHLEIDPEEALRDANKKFINRFMKMEKILENEKINIKDVSQKDLDSYWNRVKSMEN